MSTKTKTNKEFTYNTLPKKVSRKNFNPYLLPHLKKPKKGPKPKLSLYKILQLYPLCPTYGHPVESVEDEKERTALVKCLQEAQPLVEGQFV
jgi:hypothetical protein